MSLRETDPLLDSNGLLEAPRRNSVVGPRFSHFVKANAGFLLVASAQAFFALKNVAVKSLHKVEPPVSTLEVRIDGAF